MSPATASTSSNRSRSYRLWVKPRPVRAMPDSASAQRIRSWRVGGKRRLTRPTLSSGRFEVGERSDGLDTVTLGEPDVRGQDRAGARVECARVRAGDQARPGADGDRAEHQLARRDAPGVSGGLVLA